ncbi:Uma2 family endonuclease [bacterium]|nr:Uma2 family endonuclease [bacterium]
MALTQVRHKIWDSKTYYKLAETGAFTGERVELVEGEVIQMSPQNHSHASTVGRLTNLLVIEFYATHVVRVQLPLDLGSLSQPEPDFALVRWEENDQSLPHPRTADLVIEVSDSSLTFDRGEKACVYAKAGLPEYWIVNLAARQVEVLSNPGPDPEAPLGFRYHCLATWRDGAVSPGFAPEKAILLNAIFPPTQG